MAFSAAQKEKLAKILRTTTTLLDAHITSLGATFTVDKQTSIEAELTRWDTDEVGVEFAKLHPKESNKGIETFPEAIRDDIRRNIANSLEWTWASYATTGMGTMQIGL